MKCETCIYYETDEKYKGKVCTADMDQEKIVKIIAGEAKSCPFYKKIED